MTLYNQIQQLMMKCIDRNISVKAFREQFAPLFFSLNRQFDIDAVILADNVDNLYADVLIGDITEDQFRQKLIQLTPVVMMADVGSKWPPFELAFQTTTAAVKVEEVGPKTQMPETSSGDVQLILSCA